MDLIIRNNRDLQLRRRYVDTRHSRFFLVRQEEQYMKKPGIDLSECTLCESCIAVCPSVFFINDAGMVEIAELDVYPEADVNEAIKYCPEDCIFWEED